MAGRYPGLDDFFAVFRALEGAKREMAVADVQTAAKGVAASKVKVVLTSLKEAGFVAERRGSRWTLNRDAAAGEVAAIAGRYASRSADDRKKLEQMVAYGQTALCRWLVLLRYFGDSDATFNCGHCDNCTGTARPHAA